MRPGPIQGNMVHPYLQAPQLARRTVAYPSPSPEHGPPDELHKLLKDTFGVPLFQEQAMKLAMVAAKFSPEDANRLRRAMATFRNVGTIHLFEEKMVERHGRRAATSATLRSAASSRSRASAPTVFPKAMRRRLRSWSMCRHG